MKSKKRKLLKEHLNETCEFMAVVQKVDKRMNKITLCEVYLREDGEIKKVAKHLHVFNVKKEYIEMLCPLQYIWFTAKPRRYYKHDDYGEKVNNYTLGDVKNINIMEVEYDG